MSPSVLVFFTALLRIGKALPWDGPQPSISATNTANWSPRPTNDLTDKEELKLRLRSIYPVNVCGWINGDGGQPAVCSPDSSCAWNTDITRVGCCQTANNACTFYTDCTTAESLGPEGVIGSIYTCVSGSTCYQNTYPGSFLQYGCATLKGYEGTTVATSYSGENYAEPNPLQIVYVADSAAIAPTTVAAGTITPDGSTIAMPTSIAVSTAPTAEDSSTTSTITQDTFHATTTSTLPTTFSSQRSTSTSSPLISETSSSPTPTTTLTPIPPKPSNTGPIVGGIIGGLAFLFAIFAFCFVGRRKGWFSKSSSSSSNQEMPTGQYIPPVYQQPQSYEPKETKAELLGDTGYAGVRGVSMMDSERSYGRSEMSAATSPRMDDGSTYTGNDGISNPRTPVLVDDRFMRSRMNGASGSGPIYEAP